MLAKEAFDSVCAKVAALYEKDGWKYSKSSHWMTKKDKNITYKVFFYTSWLNVSGKNVDFYGEFAAFNAKTKRQFYYIGTQKCKVPEGKLAWNVATEDTWESTIAEFTKWLDSVSTPIMEECNNDIHAYLERAVEQGLSLSEGYIIDVPMLLEFGFRDLAEKAVLKHYEKLNEETKAEFKANYESMINGGEPVSEFGKKRMEAKGYFRAAIENKIVVDL